MVAPRSGDGSGPSGEARRARRGSRGRPVSNAPRVAVVGAGSWGTAVASLVSTNADTVLWARRPELAAAITDRRQNPDYLPGVELPAELRVTADIGEASATADVLVVGVPSHGMRAVLTQAAEFVRPAVPIVSLAKGVEQGTLRRMTEVIGEVLPTHLPERIGVLTGPNLAREIAAGQPAASVVAMGDEAAAHELQSLMMTVTFRVYTNPDVVGCEIAGALKNVMAIAAGIADGLGYGDNTKAALLTRGLAELTRLGIALGGHPLTFSGLAGMGDLVATCMSRQSRNRYFGEELAKGRTLDETEAEMNMFAAAEKTF